MMSQLLNMLSRFVIAFLPRSQMSSNFVAAVTITVILEPKKIKSIPASSFSPSIYYDVMGMDDILVFWVLSFKPAFSLSSFTLIKRFFSSSLLSALERYHLHIWGCWYFSWQSWYHSNGRKPRGTEEPLDEGERGEWKSWLVTQH